jgi:hypothetical protein
MTLKEIVTPDVTGLNLPELSAAHIESGDLMGGTLTTVARLCSSGKSLSGGVVARALRYPRSRAGLDPAATAH